MTKENGSRKLVLKRETLAPLQAEELEGVNGGRALPSMPSTTGPSTVLTIKLRELTKASAAKLTVTKK